MDEAQNPQGWPLQGTRRFSLSHVCGTKTFRNYWTAAIYSSNPAFHLIWWVCLPHLITRGIYNVIFSLFITDSFSDQSDSSTSAPGGYSGDNEQSGNHVSTLRNLLPKEAERLHFIFDKWLEKSFIDVTLEKVESWLHPNSWYWSNIRFQIRYIRVITDNLKHLSKEKYLSRCLENMIFEHGVSNPSSRVPCLRIIHFSEKLVRNIFSLTFHLNKNNKVSAIVW